MFTSYVAHHLVRTLAEDDPQRLMVGWPIVAKPPRMSLGLEFRE